MKKIGISILLIAFLLALGIIVKNTNDTTQEEENADVVLTDSFDDDEEEWEDSDLYGDGTVIKSDDGRVTIKSGIHPNGGTSPEYWAVWTIVTEKGEKRELKFSDFPYVNKLHTLKKNDGTAYYVIDCFCKASSVDGYQYLEAYKIVGDSIRNVNVEDGGKTTDINKFSINYDIPSWYFTAGKIGYDWLFEYDVNTKNLYVPVTESGCIIDRYEVWHFNGNRLVCLGTQPHKGLHKSLGEYERLMRYVTTNDYVVRVDSLNSNELRYASWKKPKTIADQLDIVIYGGKTRQHPIKPDELQRCDDYYFEAGGYEYIVNYCEVKRDNDGYGEHYDFLLLKKNGKVILKQRLTD